MGRRTSPTKADLLRVQAAEVPWAVDPAIGYVRLVATDEDMPTLTLIAEFLRPADGGLDAQGASGEGAHNAEIEVRFTWPGGWIRVTPCAGPAPFDLSGLAVVPSLGEPRAVTAARTRAHLDTTGHHPCPHFYRVEASPWLAALGLDPAKFQHFVVHGDSNLWEVIATGLSWRVLRWMRFE